MKIAGYISNNDEMGMFFLQLNHYCHHESNNMKMGCCISIVTYKNNIK
jgi:hypothetical protein